jgi:hypothetical protein
VQAQRNETTAAGGEGNSRRDGDGNGNENGEISDPLIYPGLYAPSGFDILSILVSLANLLHYLIRSRSRSRSRSTHLPVPCLSTTLLHRICLLIKSFN